MLTPLKWAGYGGSTAFAKSFDQFTMVDRWQSYDPNDSILQQNLRFIGSVIGSVPVSYLVATPDVIVQNYETRYPTIYQRVNSSAKAGTTTPILRTESVQITLRWLPSEMNQQSPFAGTNAWTITLKSADGRTLGPVALLDKSTDSTRDSWRTDCTTLVTTAYGPHFGEIVSVELSSTGANQVKFGQAVVQVKRMGRTKAVFLDDRNGTG